VGLNPLTRPFEYLELNSKTRLYALRDCTDQLRRRDGISVYIVNRERISDIYVVTARAKDRHGREDESTGAVTVGNLKGDALANALMKAETKSKRRVTLSIAGLGWLDESELDTIPAWGGDHRGKPGSMNLDEEIDPRLGTLLNGGLPDVSAAEMTVVDEPKKPPMTPAERAQWHSLLNTIQAVYAKIMALPKAARVGQIEVYLQALGITSNEALLVCSLQQLTDGHARLMTALHPTSGQLEELQDLARSCGHDQAAFVAQIRRLLDVPPDVPMSRAQIRERMTMGHYEAATQEYLAQLDALRTAEAQEPQPANDVVGETPSATTVDPAMPSASDWHRLVVRAERLKMPREDWDALKAKGWEQAIVVIEDYEKLAQKDARASAEVSG